MQFMLTKGEKDVPICASAPRRNEVQSPLLNWNPFFQLIPSSSALRMFFHCGDRNVIEIAFAFNSKSSQRQKQNHLIISAPSTSENFKSRALLLQWASKLNTKRQL